MKIEIWSDFISPHCYLGKKRLEIALEKFEQRDYVKIEFKSFPLYDKESLFFKTQNKIIEQYDFLLEEAKRLNVSLELLSIDEIKQLNTLDAHRLSKFAEQQGKGKELIDLLFYRFFHDKMNISQTKSLSQIAVELGFDRLEIMEFLSMRKFSRAVMEDEAIAKEIGIEEVPYFIFNETYGVEGDQPIEVLLDALKVCWQEDSERIMARQTKQNITSYCEGDDCDV